jgi:hypothetical protein
MAEADQQLAKKLLSGLIGVGQIGQCRVWGAVIIYGRRYGAAPPFDDAYRPKPAVNAMIKAFAKPKP